MSASRLARVVGRYQADLGPGSASSGASRRRSSGGKMGSVVGWPGVKGPHPFSLCSLRDSTTPVVGSASPHSQGRPLLGQTRCFWLLVAAAAGAPPAALLAAMASSVYAPGSDLAKALKASRMGR